MLTPPAPSIPDLSLMTTAYKHHRHNYFIFIILMETQAFLNSFMSYDSLTLNQCPVLYQPKTIRRKCYSSSALLHFILLFYGKNCITEKIRHSICSAILSVNTLLLMLCVIVSCCNLFEDCGSEVTEDASKYWKETKLCSYTKISP